MYFREAGDYDKCLEGEYVSRTMSLLNCTPPWMTEKEELWCGPDLHMTALTLDRMYLLFDLIRES